MANFLRVISAVALFLLAGLAHALPPTVVYYNVYPAGPNYSTVNAACEAAFAFFNTQGNGTYVFLSTQVEYPGYRCVGTKTWQGNTEDIGSMVHEKLICSDPNTSLVGANCLCSTNYVEEGNQCVRAPDNCEPGYHKENGVCVPDDCQAGEIRVNGVCVKEPDCPEGTTRENGKCVERRCPKAGTFAGQYDVANKTPTFFCEGGCQVSIKTFLTAIKDGKVVDIVGMGFYTGGTCNGPSTPGDQPPGNDPDPDPDDDGEPGEPGDPENPDDPDDPTGPGTGGGGNNGGSGDNPTPPTNPNNPDRPPQPCPNGNCTGDTDPGSPDGVGEGPDGEGQCQPDQYMGADGLCYGRDEEEEDPDNEGHCSPGWTAVDGRCVPYKPDNPEEDEDDEPSSFGGACGGFMCKGDAVQCAIAKEQHFRNCQLFVDTSPESKLYYKEAGKAGNQTLGLEGNETVNMAGRIDSTDALGGGGGATDFVFTIHGQQITIPFSALNPYLSAFGNILIAIAFLIAMRIVGKG